MQYALGTKKRKSLKVCIRNIAFKGIRTWHVVRWHFWPRATLKGPKRSFVVVVLVVLVVGVETWAKNVRQWKSGLVQLSMTLFDLFWSCMVLYVFYGLLWQNIDLIGLVSSFLAVIDPNSFGLVLRNVK